MVTPGGWEMSVALTNCGQVGWVTARRGYRYDPIDPATGRSWPAMPRAFADLAIEAADTAGFDGFQPDACLVNRYAPGARSSLHQDRNEREFDQPIVSVSLGLPAVFMWGGKKRADRVRRSPSVHGDAMVWGGPDRLAFHGVRSLAEGEHSPVPTASTLPSGGHFEFPSLPVRDARRDLETPRCAQAYAWTSQGIHARH